MDLDESSENKHAIKSCVDLKQNILASLNITSGITKTTLILWNKFQLFVYDTINSDVKYFVPEFHIKEILVFNNIIIFLDTCGNVHISSLKFKNSAQRIFKIAFRPKTQNVVAICRFSGNNVLSLKYENDLYYVCINKLNTEFQLESQSTLHIDGFVPSSPNCNNILLISKIISTDSQDCLRNVFNIKDKWREGILTVVSFDKLSIYCSVTSLTIAEPNINFVKLYTCPSPFCDVIFFESVNLLIGLRIGSAIKLELNNKQIVTEHLNCALHRFELIKSSLFYTDGDAMWNCKELFSLSQNFKQLFVQNVYYFMIYENQIAVTTFDNLLYLFSLDDESIFKNNDNKDIYCPAHKVLNNCDYLVNILEELDKNKKVVQKMSMEKNYLICLSLSKRPDIMTKMIQSTVEVFHKYEDVLLKNKDYILPQPLKKYFDENTVIFSIQFNCSALNQYFSEMLTCIKHINIHISFHTKKETLKLVSVKMYKLHNITHILLPLNVNNINDEVTIAIKLITKIPTAYDKENNLWPVLYSNSIKIKSPQFLKMEDSCKIKYLKDSQNSIEKLITESAIYLHGNLFKIKKNFNTEDSQKWTTYVKLPDTYESIFKNDELFENHLSNRQVSFLSEQMKTESFLKCKSSITLNVSSCKVVISVANEEFTNYFKLKISCDDVVVTKNLRNFFSDVFYKYFTGDNCVCSEIYTTTENIRKALKETIHSNSQSAVLPVIEEFNKDVIGACFL